MNREDQPHPRGRQMADPTAGAAYEYTRGPLPTPDPAQHRPAPARAAADADRPSVAPRRREARRREVLELRRAARGTDAGGGGGRNTERISRRRLERAKLDCHPGGAQNRETAPAGDRGRRPARAVTDETPNPRPRVRATETQSPKAAHYAGRSRRSLSATRGPALTTAPH